jgi:hypothetical protein
MKGGLEVGGGAGGAQVRGGEKGGALRANSGAVQAELK